MGAEWMTEKSNNYIIARELHLILDSSSEFGDIDIMEWETQTCGSDSLKCRAQVRSRSLPYACSSSLF